MNIFGQDHVTVVAELGLNHNGSLTRALDMVAAAKEAGADAVKVQCFGASCFATARAMWHGESQLEMFKRYELPRRAYMEIAEKCRRSGLIFFGTPDCVTHAGWLVAAGAPVLKVGSDDLVNLPLLRQLVGFGKPMILSSGMASSMEISFAIDTCASVPLAVLYCCSVYPARVDQLRLSALSRECLQPFDGLSDHTVGYAAAVSAVTLGATIIEKHFTLSHHLPGPDQTWSADPYEFKTLVDAVRGVELSLSHARWSMDQAELDMRSVARRSIVASRDLSRGHVLEDSDLALKRPGDGLPPDRIEWALGRTLTRAKLQDDPILKEDLTNGCPR